MHASGPTLPLKGSHVADELRRMILSGALTEGQPLRQAALAKQLGVSTIPIREAIRSLEQEGMVTCHPFRGASVARLLPEEVLQFARIRIALETEALALAFPFHTAETLGEARQCLNEVRLALGSGAHTDRFLVFLSRLYGPGGHPLLLAEILKVVVLSQRYAALGTALLEGLPREVPRHGAVISALEAGDLPLAQDRLRLLYGHASILAASLLYQRALEAPPVVRRPRGRPRKAR